jgi:predicted lipase
MDIDMIIDLIKSVPEDKLNDDETIKTIMDQAIKKSGKTCTEDQLNKLLQQFKELTQASDTSFISWLLSRGGSEDQIDEIKKKLDS